MYQFDITGHFHATTEALFDAFHRPEILIQWFAPGPVVITRVMANFNEGGRYRFMMQEPSGDEYVLTGEYMAIVPGERLSFSWAWEDNLEDSIITNVDLQFRAISDDTCELTLVHSGFVNEAERDQHQYAWLACLEKLSGLSLTEQPA